jgi:hypothetical protein
MVLTQSTEILIEFLHTLFMRLDTLSLESLMYLVSLAFQSTK